MTPDGSFTLAGHDWPVPAYETVDDFIDGLILMIDKGEHRQVYHIGTMEELTIAEVAQKVMATFGRIAEIIPQELPPGGTARRCPDIAKLRSLGFNPTIRLDDGLAKTATWYVAQARNRTAL